MNRRNFGARKEGAEGFSLLEVLVATALMGLVLFAVIQVLASALRAQEASRTNTQAVLAAQKILEEFGDKDVARGVFNGKDGKFAYQVSLEPQFQAPYGPQDKQLVCSLLRVTLSWEERGKIKSVEFYTLRTTVQKKS
jgi:prepilin-type N-terminal cleavage/methylation domain-containing protein